jgi:hypothetical protein
VNAPKNTPNLADLEFCDQGVRVTIRRRKTDQEGKGHTVAILRGTEQIR